jgi:hypothetical protein
MQTITFRGVHYHCKQTKYVCGDNCSSFGIIRQQIAHFLHSVIGNAYKIKIEYMYIRLKHAYMKHDIKDIDDMEYKYRLT